jgi:hypothetical protein
LNLWHALAGMPKRKGDFKRQQQMTICGDLPKQSLNMCRFTTCKEEKFYLESVSMKKCFTSQKHFFYFYIDKTEKYSNIGKKHTKKIK